MMTLAEAVGEPIVSLESVGLPLQVVTVLEKAVDGLLIGDVLRLRYEDLLRRPDVGPAYLRKFFLALDRFTGGEIRARRTTA